MASYDKAVAKPLFIFLFPGIDEKIRSSVQDR